MPGTPPITASFPSSVTCSIVDSSTYPPSNVLILLHSLGDTHTNFANLAERFNLQETICISLRGPKIMPFELPGYQWGEDINFSPNGDLCMDAKFDRAGYASLNSVVDKLLSTGWRAREIMFFGWGQGAICLFDYLSRHLDYEFAGLISIGGVVGSEVKKVIIRNKDKGDTPILACGGRKGLMTALAEDRIKSLFKNVEIVRWRKDDDGMMKDRDEAIPVMRFFSQRLLSRKGVPEGFTELNS